MKKILLLVLLMGFGATAHADTLTLQPGPAEGKDTYYGIGSVGGQEGRPDAPQLRIGGWGDQWISFIEFDLSSIPASSSVSKAEIYLYDELVTNPNNGKIFRVTEVWNEEDPSSTSSPAFVDIGMSWQPVEDNQWWIVDITNTVQGWQTGQFQNYGLRIVGEGNNNQAKHFLSSDYLADPTLRPKLVVEYTVPTSTVPTFVTLSEDVMTEIANDIEYPSVLPIYEGLMDKVVQAYERGHLVRSDRRLERFKTYIREGLGKLLFSKAERKAISAIISDMQNILVTEG
jgi:hypothetical protein